MRLSLVVLGLWLLLVAVAGAQEPEVTIEPFGPAEPIDDSGFEAIFWLMIPLAIAGAVVTLRRDWHAGSFFGRSRVDVSNDPNDRPDLVIPTALGGGGGKPSAEQRLAELARLRDRGLISEEEHARARADVLADVADG